MRLTKNRKAVIYKEWLLTKDKDALAARYRLVPAAIDNIIADGDMVASRPTT